MEIIDELFSNTSNKVGNHRALTDLQVTLCVSVQYRNNTLIRIIFVVCESLTYLRRCGRTIGSTD